MKTVFVTRSLPVDAAALAPRGVRVVTGAHERPLSAEEIASGAAFAEGLVPQLTESIDRALMERLPALRVIANYAVGVDNVDLRAAQERGIVVCNTPDVLTEATAELAFALLLALARRVREGERMVRTGAYTGWSPSLLLGRELSGATLGLFGFGRIGQAVARRAAAFGMRVLYTARRETGHEEAAERVCARRVPFESLLLESDAISIHAPLETTTRHVFGPAAFRAMKPGALLVNTARGALVDEEALVAALRSGRLGGAGLDVFEHEPAVHPGLLDRDDVVLLPHVGSATRQTREAMARLALENCFAVLEGRPPRSPVF